MLQTDNKQLAPATKRKPPAAGRGRKHGEVNITTRVLKEAILLAAEVTGKDGKGKGGLVGYLERLAINEPKSFAPLLGKVLPLQVVGPGEGGEHAVKMVVEFVRADQGS